MILITDFGYVEEYGMIIELDDEGLSQISVEPTLAYDNNFIEKYLETKNCHALIVRLVTTKRKKLAFYIDNLLKRYKSVNWVRSGRFFTRRKI